MSDERISYRYLPAVEGDHITGVERRDYTQAEWDALEPRLRRDALASGVYREAAAGDVPKWFERIQEQAAAAGETAPPMIDGETQKQYEARLAPHETQPPAEGGEAEPA